MYADDILSQCHLHHVQDLLTVVTDVFERFHFRIQRRKCAVHIPALTGTAVGEWPADALALQNLLPLACDGLVVLATDAADNQALPVGPSAAAAEQTRARAQRAYELSRAVP